MQLKAIRDKVIVHNMERGERKTQGGLVLADDDGKAYGVRPRWAQVHSVGYEAEKATDLQPGQWVLIEHGKWTRGLAVHEDGATPEVYFGVQYDHILLVSDEQPVEFASRF